MRARTFMPMVRHAKPLTFQPACPPPSERWGCIRFMSECVRRLVLRAQVACFTCYGYVQPRVIKAPTQVQGGVRLARRRAGITRPPLVTTLYVCALITPSAAQHGDCCCRRRAARTAVNSRPETKNVLNSKGAARRGNCLPVAEAGRIEPREVLRRRVLQPPAIEASREPRNHRAGTYFSAIVFTISRHSRHVSSFHIATYVIERCLTPSPSQVMLCR